MYKAVVSCMSGVSSTQKSPNTGWMTARKSLHTIITCKQNVALGWTGRWRSGVTADGVYCQWWSRSLSFWLLAHPNRSVAAAAGAVWAPFMPTPSAVASTLGWIHWLWAGASAWAELRLHSGRSLHPRDYIHCMAPRRGGTAPPTSTPAGNGDRRICSPNKSGMFGLEHIFHLVWLSNKVVIFQHTSCRWFQITSIK